LHEQFAVHYLIDGLSDVQAGRQAGCGRMDGRMGRQATGERADWRTGGQMDRRTEASGQAD